MDRKVLGITEWVDTLRSDDLLALMIGWSPDSLPPLGSYYDFIQRLWLRPLASQNNGRKDLFPFDKNKKSLKSPGKGRNLPNRNSGITAVVAANALSEKIFLFIMKSFFRIYFPLLLLVFLLNLSSTCSEAALVKALLSSPNSIVTWI